MTQISKKKIDIVIVDDESKALNYLKIIIKDSLENNNYFTVNNIFTFNNSYEALDFLEKNVVHLAFLDINMPGKNGIELAEEIKKIKINNQTHFPITCFTTAYDNYALEAFKHDVFDYIMKPIFQEQLDNFFEKFAKTISFENYGQFITINNNGLVQKMKIEDIQYIKSEGKYINISTPGKKIMIVDSLASFENKHSYLIKIHRSYIINKIYVENIIQKDNQLFIKLKDIQEEFSVSRRNRADVEQELNLFLNVI